MTLLTILGVVIAALISMPVLNLAFGWISAPDNVLLTGGIAILIALILMWYGIVIHLYRKFTKKQLGNLAVVAMILAGAFYSSACGVTTIKPGYVGIKVNAYGEDRGVSSYPVTTGRVTYNPFTTSILEWPTFVQPATWTANLHEGNPVNEEITFNTADQMVVAADISIAYHLRAEKVPAFYVKFRNNDISQFTHGFLRNMTREKFDSVAGKYKIESIMGDNAPFLKEVKTELAKEVESIGVEIDQFGFANAPRPPKEVQDAINARTQATQNAITSENQLRQATAEAQKRVASAEGDARARVAAAEGEAKANRVIADSVTDRVLEFRRLQIQQQAIARWNGEMPHYTGSGALPFIQIPSK